MALIIAEYPDPIPGPGGVRFKAKACALSTPRGGWQAWIEFNPLNGDPTFRSPRETEQPTRQALALWADGLSTPALSEALDRALDRLGMCRT